MSDTTKFAETLDPQYYRKAVERSEDCMKASIERTVPMRREPCVSIYMPEGHCLVDGRPDTVRIQWGGA